MEWPYTIPYHTIPYHTIPYHTIPYHTIPYHTIPYHTIPYHTIPYHTIPYHTIPYHTIPYHTIPYHTIPYHTIPYHTIPYHTIPYHTIPYHTIPYHTIPYHTIPYHTIPYHTIPYHTNCVKIAWLCSCCRSRFLISPTGVQRCLSVKPRVRTRRRIHYTTRCTYPRLWAKNIKKNTTSTQNKSQTDRAKQYEVTSFLSTDCELSTDTCSKNVYSLGPMMVCYTWFYFSSIESTSRIACRHTQRQWRFHWAVLYIFLAVCTQRWSHAH